MFQFHAHFHLVIFRCYRQEAASFVKEIPLQNSENLLAYFPLSLFILLQFVVMT